MNAPGPTESVATNAMKQRLEQARLQLLRLAGDTTRDCQELITTVSRISAQALGVERVGVWLLADAGKALRCLHLYQHTGTKVFAGTVLRQEDFPTYFAALMNRRAIPADDARTDPLTHELDGAYLRPLRITSMLDAPIYSKGCVIGVVCHEDTGVGHQWSTAEYDFAAAVADTLSRLLAEHKRLDAEDRAEKYEAQVRELHRMEALGRAAANIAHDFRNVLGAVSGFAELIQAMPDSNATSREYALRIIESADRGRQMTQQLLVFAAHDRLEPRILDVRELIHSISGMLQVLVGKRVRMHFKLDDATGRVLIDAAQLERALINLVMNASEAMPGGGDLTVALHQPAGGEQLVINVTDTGVGIDPHEHTQIFEPFYTTKGKHGTGLGLTIVQQVVTRAGGSVAVDSRPGRGTTISLQLPCVAHEEALLTS